MNVQLVDAESGNHLWAERFDKPVAQLFDMQDEIVARWPINSARSFLPPKLAGKGASSPDLIDLVLQGWA